MLRVWCNGVNLISSLKLFQWLGELIENLLLQSQLNLLEVPVQNCSLVFFRQLRWDSVVLVSLTGTVAERVKFLK